jgi:hypothetical protein
MFGAWAGPLVGACVAGTAVLLAVRGKPLLGFVLAAVVLTLKAILWTLRAGHPTVLTLRGQGPGRATWSNVSADATLREIVNLQAIDRGIQNYAVKQGDQLRGLLTLKTIESIPKRHWAATRASEVMTPIHRPHRDPQKRVLVGQRDAP